MKMNFRTFVSNTRYKLFSITPLVFVAMMGLCGKTVSTGIPILAPIEEKQEVVQPPKVLNGNVSVEKELPTEFYGTWKVISIRTETNNPELFLSKSSDIWTFSRVGDVITLSNPINKATSSITVNSVNGKTAVFSRMKKDEDSVEIEQAEINVQDDTFSGTDYLLINIFKNGQKIRTDIVKYNVKGYKISGKTLNDIFAK